MIHGRVGIPPEYKVTSTPRATSRVLEFDIDAARGRIPVVTGGTFNIWDPTRGAEGVRTDRCISATYLNQKAGAIGPSERPVGLHRIEFAAGPAPARLEPVSPFADDREATEITDTIACLLPPGTAAVNAAPVLVKGAVARRGRAVSARRAVQHPVRLVRRAGG